LEQHFDLDKEFDIVELEARSAASPDGQVIIISGSGSGGSGGGVGSGSVGSGSVGSGSVGSGSVGSGSVGSGGGSGT
jgi:hypothetical protein